MKTNAQVLSELRAWRDKWIKRSPDRFDHHEWDAVMTELSGIVSKGEMTGRVKIFAPIVCKYIADIERGSHENKRVLLSEQRGNKTEE